MAPKHRTGRTRSERTAHLLELGGGIAVVLLAIYIAGFLRIRADLTSEQRYTLTPATRELVRGLQDIVYVKVYLDGELPADLRRLRQAVRDLLDEFRAEQPDLVQYTFIDPSAGNDDALRRQVYDKLQEQGLRYSSIRLRGKSGFSEHIVFPGALVTFRDKTVPVQLLRGQLRPEANDAAEMVNRSINNLEYAFASAIRQVTSVRRPRIAFLEGHGELPAPQVMDITKALEERYTVSRVRIDERIDALSDRNPAGNYRLNKYELLIVAKPDSLFPPRDRYVIDQFVMNGGRVLWLVDAMNAHLDSLRKNQVSIATPLDLGLDELLFAYGARINKDLIVDQSCAPIEVFTERFGDEPKLERLPWYFEPVLIAESHHPVVSNIDPVHTRFVSSMDTIGAEGVRKTILLTSSPRSRFLRSPVRISLGILQVDMDFARSSTPRMPVAVLLEGRFNSAYTDRLPPAFSTDPAVGHRDQGAPSAMLVVSDGDVIANRVDPVRGMVYPLGYDRHVKARIYGNREFLVNAVDHLLDDGALITVRSRAITLRQLDPARIEDERTQWQVTATALPILLSLAAGLFFHLWRRRTYAIPHATAA
jgi:ABC-2 type transport system permease protein